MADTFWGSHLSDPKRKFRFLVKIGNLPDWVAITAQKPTFEIGEATHAFLNHTFKYPGRVTWQDITVTVRDPVAPDVSSVLIQMLTDSGYYFPIKPPTSSNGGYSTVSKAAAVAANKNIIIRQIDGEGNTLEKWTLKNAWVKSVSFSDLDYNSDELTEISLTLTYDWAEFSNTD